jgi:hypothetical protein
MGTVPGTVLRVSQVASGTGSRAANPTLVPGPNSTGAFMLTSNSIAALSLGPVRKVTCRPTRQATSIAILLAIPTVVCGAVRGVIR